MSALFSNKKRIFYQLCSLLLFYRKDGILIFATQKSECRKKVSKRLMGFEEEGKNF